MTTERTAPLVLPIEEVGLADLALVGGKSAQLGELVRIDGVRVPPGFVVTTEAFRAVIAATPGLDDRIEELSRLGAEDTEALSTSIAAIRAAIEGASLPPDLIEAVTRLVAAAGEGAAWAVRSSATAEDLPTASFAGQHDSHLNVIGADAVLLHVSRCWASLFSDRAVSYRARSGVDHRTAAMAVVVQRQLHPRASGVLFTADPITSNRRVATIEAVFGLGEALVSGRLAPDGYTMRDGAVVTSSIAPKAFAVEPTAGGGIVEVALPADRQREPVLTEAEAVRLVELARRIEAHLGRPQDIEWCLVGDDFHVVQSRAITTLFPLPAASDEAYRIYVSVGHGQMMTDAMRPLGLSVWQHTAMIPMHEAGGRLFVDVTARLQSPVTRAATLDVFGRADPLLRDALETALSRPQFVAASDDAAATAPGGGAAPPEIEVDPALVAELVARSEASLEALRGEIRGRSGVDLLDFILGDFEELKRVFADARSTQAVMAGMGALEWLNDHLEAWLGEKGAADALMQSVPGNVTSEMGRALLDVADAIRPHPEAVRALEAARDDNFLEALVAAPGGRESREALDRFLDRYGARCVGEIDITRPRWAEHPLALVPLLLGNIRNSEAGAAERQFEEGARAAEAQAHQLLERLRELPDGAAKAAETQQMIERLRTFIGYREYPKFAIIERHYIYKQALREEAERLVAAGVLRDRDDIFELTLEELREVAHSSRLDASLVARRREAFEQYRTLAPPRVLTSEGETLDGAYGRRGDLLRGALGGIAVSAGVAEGRARVVRRIEDAHDLGPGDILVTVGTDPSWSPAFASIAGLVTEVGGLMTHGAVIAREYGLPAVVGVTRATRVIRDGQRIRVHGTEGYVELLRGE